ncbi:MAG: YIP1 family protein [Candidatus Aenigmatarchaeota archaeon]
MLCRKAKEFLSSPSTAFEKEKKSQLGDAGKYMLVVGFILALINGIVGAITFSFSSAYPGAAFVGGFSFFVAASGFILQFALTYVFLFVGLSIWSLWLHLWVYLMGGKGLEKTMKSVYYGETPSYVFGWIPSLILVGTVMSPTVLSDPASMVTTLSLLGIAILISILVGLWSFVITGKGLMKLHGMTCGRAASSLVLAIIIPLAIILVIGLAIALAFIGMFAGSPDLLAGAFTAI